MKREGLERLKREAKARLVAMLVHETSLVDRAANERRFLLVKAHMKTKKTEKSETGGAVAAESGTAGAADAAAAQKTEETADQAKAELVLPPEAKQALVDSIGACIETVSALAALVAEAKTEEGAPVPPDLAEMLRSAAGELTSVADQYAAAAAPAEGAAPPAKAEETKAEPAAGVSPELVAAIEQAMDRVIDRRTKPAEKSEDAGDTGTTATTATKSLLEKKLDELSVIVKATHAASILAPLVTPRAQSNVGQVQKTPRTEAPAPASGDGEQAWPTDLSAQFAKPPAPKSPADSRR